MSTKIALAWLTAAVCIAPAVAQQKDRRASGDMVLQKDASYLGIGVQDVDAERAKALKLKEDRGAEITSVDPDTPAFKAGLKPGDVVLEYNGTAVEGMEHLQRLVRQTPPGRSVKLNVWRNGMAQTLTATVGQRKGLWIETPDGQMSIMMPTMPDMVPMPPMPVAAPRMITIMPSSMLGIEGEPLNQEPQFAEFMGVKDGVLIKAVFPRSAAERAGIKAGDVIVKIDETRVSSSSEITGVLRTSRGKKSFNVTLVRAHKEMSIPVSLEER